ncbi:hypothetical protein COO60DRAFT_1463523 [Scenedesmus sp. NREL 46B-D3]|nr:hypothetical protein COO60DRAFT_1463523 [Scenedesmus sp. NREL 46B-D3]
MLPCCYMLLQTTQIHAESGVGVSIEPQLLRTASLMHDAPAARHASGNADVLLLRFYKQIKITPAEAAASSVCNTCVCALVSTFAPALAAGGVTFDAAAPESFPLAQAAGIVRSCAEEYLVAMMTAGVNVTALAELNNCNFASATDVPTCLATEIEGVNTANSTVSNATTSSRTGVDDLSGVTVPEGTAAASALRIATVQATPAGPVFTLAGQLDSASQLLQAMAASQDLVAAMTPEAVTQLNTLAADASKIDANPATTTVLAGLENPINGVELLTQIAQLNAEAPADTAAPVAGSADVAGNADVTAQQGPAAPAPAAAVPAPPNSAGAQGVAVMATAGAALLAVLLL